MNIIEAISSRKLEIVNGPSREAVYDALKYAHEKKLGSSALDTEFVAKMSYAKVKLKGVKLNSLAHESNTGYDFLLTGHCLVNNKFGTPGRPEYRQFKFEAHYSAQTRKGTIKLKAC